MDSGSIATILNDALSDYGSDIDLQGEDLILQLLDQMPAECDACTKGIAFHPHPSCPRFKADAEDTSCHSDLYALSSNSLTDGKLSRSGQDGQDHSPEGSHRVEADSIKEKAESALSTTALPRTPWERFRSSRKALTVTDLVSGVWCEQQFEYTLERKFKRRTPQMKKGSKMHKVLEDEVHTTVDIIITTKEDAWGLRIFNMCQGLRGLRESGLAREFPVFGFLDGEILVRGIIDEISYVTSGGQKQTTSDERKAPQKRKRGRPKKLSADLSQGRLSQYIERPKIIQLSDTKTRASKTMPTAAQIRSTSLQLMLYYSLLHDLYSGNVDFSKILSTYSLDGRAPFSDHFIAQIAELDPSTPLEDHLDHNNLWGLWEILQTELRESITNISDTLGVSYLSQVDSSVIGSQQFEMDKGALARHLEDTIKWWRGQRQTRGVDIEEAWKCQHCDFEVDCSWRLGKLKELSKVHADKRKR